MSKRIEPPDEEYIAEVRRDLEDEGYDEDFIDCVIDELRDGSSVVVTKVPGND